MDLNKSPASLSSGSLSSVSLSSSTDCVEEFHGDAPFAGEYLLINRHNSNCVRKLSHESLLKSDVTCGFRLSFILIFKRAILGSVFKCRESRLQADNTIFHFHYKGLAHKFAFQSAKQTHLNNEKKCERILEQFCSFSFIFRSICILFTSVDQWMRSKQCRVS